MRCSIIWNELPLGEWEKRFATIKRSTLLQSYDYARGICPLKKQKARWGLILIDNQEAGLVQLFEAELFGNLIHAIMIDRGPLWFDGFGSEDHFEAFLSEINAQFPKRIGRRRRIIPEITDSPQIRDILARHNFRPAHDELHKTIWLDLEQDGEALRAGLKKSWHGSLKKAEKSELSVEWDWDGAHLPELLTYYTLDRQEKNYPGPSSKLIRNLATIMVPQRRFMIGRAVLKGEAVGGILILLHGQSATYQIGWNGPKGRQLCAHHLLLMRAIHGLKEEGIKSFDLGGINDGDAKHVGQFKTGMGGTLFGAPGVYI